MTGVWIQVAIDWWPRCRRYGLDLRSPQPTLTTASGSRHSRHSVRRSTPCRISSTRRMSPISQLASRRPAQMVRPRHTHLRSALPTSAQLCPPQHSSAQLDSTQLGSFNSATSLTRLSAASVTFVHLLRRHLCRTVTWLQTAHHAYAAQPRRCPSLSSARRAAPAWLTAAADTHTSVTAVPRVATARRRHRPPLLAA